MASTTEHTTEVLDRIAERADALMDVLPLFDREARADVARGVSRAMFRVEQAAIEHGGDRHRLTDRCLLLQARLVGRIDRA